MLVHIVYYNSCYVFYISCYLQILLLNLHLLLSYIRKSISLKRVTFDCRSKCEAAPIPNLKPPVSAVFNTPARLPVTPQLFISENMLFLG